MREAARAPTSTPSGIRRLVENIHWTWERKLLDGLPITFEDLTYSSKSSKRAQLDRNYWNPDSWESALSKIKSRDNKPSSVEVSTQSQTKSSRSQGFCMVGGVLYHHHQDLTLHIFYRSTELFQKHTADLLWLRERIPEPVKRIHFHAATAYQSALYFPIYARMVDKPHLLLKETDQVGRVVVGRGLQPFLQPSDLHTYRPTVRMREYFLKYVSEPKIKLIDKYSPKLLRQEKLE